MKRHTRLWTREHRLRTISRWRRLLPQISRYDWYSRLPDGLFNKHTESCDCGMCRLERASRKFRTRKRRVYRTLDRLEMAGLEVCVEVVR